MAMITLDAAERRITGTKDRFSRVTETTAGTVNAEMATNPPHKNHTRCWSVIGRLY
jgi:hypothetical protein